MSIILRKVGGIFGALFRVNGTSYCAGSGRAGVVSALLGLLASPFALMVLALAFVGAWLFASGPVELAAVPFALPVLMAESNRRVELSEKLGEKQKVLLEVATLIGEDNDFSKKGVCEKLGATDAADAVLKFQSLNREADDIGCDIKNLIIDETKRDAFTREEERTKVVVTKGVHSPYGEDGLPKSWAMRFVESKEYKQSRDTKQNYPFSMEDITLKTLFETAAGFLPESVRSGLVVSKATRPIQVVDLIPSFPTNQPSFIYMEETTRTHSAVEKAEGAAYPEDAYVFTPRTSPVQKIPTSIPVTDEQLDDEQNVRSLLEQRISFGIRQRFDSQILVGNGTPPNLRGINAVVGIQVQAKGADSGIVAFLKALTLIRFTGRANPTGAVFHPNDWQDILLTQSTAGEFLFGNPFQGPGPQSLFGIPIALSDAQTENTGLVADFATFTRIDERKGVTVSTGYVGSQFTEGKVTLRAEMRAAFTVTRPAAVAQITGI